MIDKRYVTNIFVCENVLISALIAFCTFAKVEVNQGMNPSKVTNDFDVDLDKIDDSDANREMFRDLNGDSVAALKRIEI